MRKFDFIVLGGGVSGLGFAKRISEHEKSVLVLEKERVVGGLSRTLHHKGFYLDFCAHRFHTNNKALLTEILSLPGLTMERHIKKSRIYMFGRYLRYPFEIQNLLRAMPLTDSIPSGISFLWNLIAKRFKPRGPFRSYKEWFVYFYGERLYQVMCYPYTSKIWHTDPALISGDWADQRFNGDNIGKLLKRILRKILTLDFSNYNLEDDSLAPDGGPFYYPQRGIQEMCDALKNSAVSSGAEIVCNVEIIRVNTEERTVRVRYGGIEETVAYDQLISTIPLHELYKLQDRKDQLVETALNNLRYMDIIFVYVFLNKPRVSNDHWLYFPDVDIIFNRAVEFSNWSPHMCPPDKTSICFDITTFKENPEWNMTDEELGDRVIRDAARIKYFDRKDVDSYYVSRVTHAYPYYDINYKEKLDTVVRFLEQNGTHLLGRTGIFRYNNSDNSIEMGFALAEKFLAGAKDTGSIYSYSIKQVSY